MGTTAFTETLIAARQALGFKSARSFFLHLERLGKLHVNYAHYAKIEGGKSFPSAELVAGVAQALGAQGEGLILAFCEAQFPGSGHLFRRVELPVAAQAQAAGSSPEGQTPTMLKQKFLTERQIAVLTESQAHYYLFLVLTLARTAAKRESLRKTPYFASLSPKMFDQMLESMERVKLINVQDGWVVSTSNELRFPLEVSAATEKRYAQKRVWEKEFDKALGFKGLVQKMMIRRVSPRYLSLIVNQANALLDLIRASEETNLQHNEEVLNLSLSLSQGRLPG